jgi:hypothetical protein
VALASAGPRDHLRALWRHGEVLCPSRCRSPAFLWALKWRVWSWRVNGFYLFGELATSIWSWVYGDPVGAAGWCIRAPSTTKPGRWPPRRAPNPGLGQLYRTETETRKPRPQHARSTAEVVVPSTRRDGWASGVRRGPRRAPGAPISKRGAIW